MKLKSVLTFLYLVVSIPLFLFFKAEIVIWLSFFVNVLLITGVTYYHLNLEKTFSPFLTSFIVFIYLFFIVAPIIQISSFKSVNAVFPNNYPYDKMDIIYANILIFAFVLVFFVSYVFLKQQQNTNKHLIYNTSPSTPLSILTIFILCLIIFILNYNYIIKDITQSIYIVEAESVSSLLIKRKVLFLIPLGGIAITYIYLKERKKLTTNRLVAFFVLIALILILLFFKNPLTEKRNALGPIYITLIYIFKPKLINSNAKFFLFMFLSMVVVFPIMSTFTHIDASLKEMIVTPSLIVDSFIRFGGVANAFSSLHYDAYANIMATVDYVNVNGLSFGYQLLGTLFFFVPRGIWVSKPLSSGELVGDYLIGNYDFTFNNLSNSMVSEGYMNFGLLGTFLFAILLSYFIVKFIKWMKSGDYLKEIMAFYFAVHLIFFLRGDLTNGFAYFIGPLLGALLVPKIIKLIFKKIKYKT
jgi:hypothetical protein